MPKYNIISNNEIPQEPEVYDELDIPSVVFIDNADDDDLQVTTYVMTGVKALVGEKAWIFNSVNEMNEWLNNPVNVKKLTAGDDIRIKADNAPSYWWDGTQLRVSDSGLTIEEVARVYSEAVNNVFK